jgi:endo-1,4-beta-D-glucanase Y
LLKQAEAGVILVSAIEGFDNSGGTTFNPSYYVFPVIRTFAKELPDPVWQRVWNDGLNLLTSAYFGPWELTPDWGYLTRSSDMPSMRAAVCHAFRSMRSG